MELFIDYDAFEHGRCRVPAIAEKFTLHNTQLSRQLRHCDSLITVDDEESPWPRYQ